MPCVWSPLLIVVGFIWVPDPCIGAPVTNTCDACSVSRCGLIAGVASNCPGWKNPIPWWGSIIVFAAIHGGTPNWPAIIAICAACHGPRTCPLSLSAKRTCCCWRKGKPPSAWPPFPPPFQLPFRPPPPTGMPPIMAPLAGDKITMDRAGPGIRIGTTSQRNISVVTAVLPSCPAPPASRVSPVAVCDSLLPDLFHCGVSCLHGPPECCRPGDPHAVRWLMKLLGFCFRRTSVLNLARKMKKKKKKSWKMMVKISNATGEGIFLSLAGAKGLLPEVFCWMGIAQTIETGCTRTARASGRTHGNFHRLSP